ncbi:MAG: tyrosine-type recombinase/integrase [Mycobacteriales bacterium]
MYSSARVCSPQLASGRRKTVYGRTQRAVLGQVAALRRARDAGLPVATGRGQTLGDYLQTWLAETLPARVAAGRLKPSTLDSYTENVRLHVLPYLARQPLTLPPAALRSWVSQLLQAPQLPRCSACAATRWRDPKLGYCPRHIERVRAADWPKLSARTVAYCHAIVRAALADAVDDELLARNVAVLVSPPTGPRRPAQPLTPAEAGRLVAAASTDPLVVLWLLLLGTGLRRGEALGLRWRAVDLEAATIRVERSLQRLRAPAQVGQPARRVGRLVEVTPKTVASAATVPLPALVTEALRAHREAQAAARASAPAWVDPDLVFTTGVGTALEPRNVNRAWAALCERAGIRQVRLHDLRHSTASFLLLQGVDIKVVQTILRHSRLATTADQYTHVLDQLHTQAAQRMDDFLRGLSCP